MKDLSTVLLICYWGSGDVLTASTVMPHVKALSGLSGITKLILVTIERGDTPTKNLSGMGKVYHVGISSKNYTINLFNKVNDYLLISKELLAIVERERINKLIAFGSLAGGLALKVHSKTKLPFYVAYYEPHATYMLDTGVWKFYDPRYIFQQYWDRQQARKADGLITVSKAFTRFIIEEGLTDSKKVQHIQNTVDLDLFAFNPEFRERIRAKLSIPNGCKIGIYVGKFGDLYYKEEAFKIYKACFETIPDFRLIILSPQNSSEILDEVTKYGIDNNRVFVTSVTHSEVPVYLSAADFALATIKSYPSAKYCSPVKIGEYWANGLPVILTAGVGDESDIIETEGGGATFDLQKEGNVKKAIQAVLNIISNPSHRLEIQKLAQKYRSPDKIEKAYSYFINNRKEKAV